jgi:serpin B
MIRIIAILLFISLFSLHIEPLASKAWSGTTEDKGRITAVSDSTNIFAIELYKRSIIPNDNLFLSPYSIYTVFAMVYGGARGNTATQMERAFHFPLSGMDLHEHVRRLSSAIEASGQTGNLKLNIANGLWPQDGYPFLEGYLNMTERYYRAKISPLEYRKESEDARKTINGWVEEKTEQKIVNLLKPGMINPLTRMVLVNAIYFKGDWLSKFDKNITQEAQFFLLSGDVVKAPLMTIRQNYGYSDFPDAQILELPYAGQDVSMLVVLPKKKDGLSELEKNLSQKRLKEWSSSMGKREIIVYMPRFKVTSELRLDQMLASMGMPDAFNHGKADLSGMDGKKDNLFIGVAIHKAYVDVNEEGTEAAAATAVGIQTTSMPAPTPVFRADHPFLFMIRHNSTGAILFMGRVVNPLKNLDT